MWAGEAWEMHISWTSYRAGKQADCPRLLRVSLRPGAMTAQQAPKQRLLLSICAGTTAWSKRHASPHKTAHRAVVEVCIELVGRLLVLEAQQHEADKHLILPPDQAHLPHRGQVGPHKGAEVGHAHAQRQGQHAQALAPAALPGKHRREMPETAWQPSTCCAERGQHDWQVEHRPCTRVQAAANMGVACRSAPEHAADGP